VAYFPVDEDRDVAAFLRLQEIISRRGYVTEADEQTWLRNSVNSRALVAHLAAGNYDCVVAGPYLFGLVHAALRAAPAAAVLVPCLHDEGFAGTRAVADLFRRVRAILFNSAPERELAQRLYGLPKTAGAVVGMGIEPFDVSGEGMAAELGLAAPYMLYSGRREDGKGTPLLMEYLALFRERTGRDVKLVLTGSGEIHPPESLRPHVRDLGFVSEAVKRRVMAGALAFCQPSVNESFSIVLLEAWMARAPALVHAACAVTRRHCEESGGGLWFRTYPEFEEELRLLLDRPDLRAALGAAGRAYVRREYAWDAIDRRLLAALDTLGEAAP
jgi:glycosyltransferase involved in cell wall biosynthesis